MEPSVYLTQQREQFRRKIYPVQPNSILATIYRPEKYVDRVRTNLHKFPKNRYTSPQKKKKIYIARKRINGGKQQLRSNWRASSGSEKCAGCVFSRARAQKWKIEESERERNNGSLANCVESRIEKGRAACTSAKRLSSHSGEDESFSMTRRR